MTELYKTIIKLQENTTRDPETILSMWKDLDKIEAEIDFEEKWTVLEQFCLAAIDLNDEEIIDTCLSRLHKQFPNSNRVKLLDIMANKERVGDFASANQMYNEMLREDETNASVRKRKIAVLVGQKLYSDAIRELCDYLRKFMNDQEAWKELCELYLLEQDYSKAIFCMEELLLSNPSSHIYHIRLAEIYYSQGESREMARSYYSQALKLSPTNMRALLGLHLTLSHMLESNSLAALQRKEVEKQQINVKKTILEQYSSVGKSNYLIEDSVAAGLLLNSAGKSKNE